MAAGDELFDDTGMDLDVVPVPSKASRFQPKIKGKGKVKVETSPSPWPTPKPASATEEQSLPHSVTTKSSKDPNFHDPAVGNCVNGADAEAINGSLDVDDEEDFVVREFDVYINPSLDSDTKLYHMQYPLRPSWRPYEMDERCEEVRMKPTLSQFEIELSLDVDNDENYNKCCDDNLMITTQTLSSATKPFVNEFAVGVLRGNQFYVNPMHSVVQFRPSMAYVDGGQKVKQDGQHIETNLKHVEENLKSSLKVSTNKVKLGQENLKSSLKVNQDGQHIDTNLKHVEENLKSSLKVSTNKGSSLQEDGNDANEQFDINEPWVSLEYHASDSPASFIYQEKAVAAEKNSIPFAMNSSDYLHSFALATAGHTRKTKGPSKRILLTKPLEERLKLWLSEGPQVSRFDALLHLAPTDSVDDVLRLLQHHAYLVQGLWVSKSSLLYDGLVALYRDYILVQFSKNRAVNDGKLKLVKPEDVRKGLLKPLAVERSLFNDWKFKEDTDLSFIKQYPEIVKEQEHGWLIREKEIMESLPGGGRSIPTMLKNSINLYSSSKAIGNLVEPGHKGRSGAATMPNKGQEALLKAVVELLQLHKVLSLSSIIQGLQGKEDARLPEVENVVDQIAIKIHDVYILKSLGKPALDQFRNVVIEYFIGKGRTAKVKKQEIKLAAQYRLKRDVSDADYTQVMNELCMSSGGSWLLKGGALR